MKVEELKATAAQVRRDIVRMVHGCQSGHPGGSLGCTDLVTALYFHAMKIDDSKGADGYLNFSKEGKGEDLFFLSNGHISPLFYSVLARRGYFDIKEMTTFRKINSRLQGHPNMNYVDGVDMSTGSLGQGLSAAVGMALSYKLHNEPYRVYSLVGDGESQEGMIWEAAMAAAHYKLDNLCAVLDWNGLQIDGDITKVMNPLPLDEKFKAFGWHVILVDGHDYDQLFAAYAEARTVKGQPTMIVAKCVKGKGVSFMENQAGWHGVAPTPEQAEAALKELV